MAADYDAELAALQHEFRELVVSVHREVGMALGEVDQFVLVDVSW